MSGLRSIANPETLFYVSRVRISLMFYTNLKPSIGDSRTPHYNVSPKGENSRFVVYTCYAPVSTATQEELQLKKWLFENTKGHSHWPQALQPFVEEFVTPMRNGEPCPHNQWKPRAPPQLSERGYKLTGIPYIKASA